MIGALIQASGAPQAVEQVVQAEQAGIPAIWATTGWKSAAHPDKAIGLRHFAEMVILER